MRDRAATLRDLQAAFEPGAAGAGALAGSEFAQLLADAERTGVLLTFAALLADRSRCLDDHVRFALDWAQRTVATFNNGVVAGSRRLQVERGRVQGLLAVLEALAARGEEGLGGPDPHGGGGALARLRHRCRVEMLRMEMLAAVPEEMRKEASQQVLGDQLAARQAVLRKGGSPLLHDKLCDVFAQPSSTLAAGQRGAKHVISALVESLLLARKSWQQAPYTGQEDEEHVQKESELERAARLCLLYYEACQCCPDVSAVVQSAHLVLVRQEQMVEALNRSLQGSSADAAAALALFWLDAVDCDSHVNLAARFICRSGVSAVLSEVRLSPLCHRLLTNLTSSVAGLEACCAMHRHDAALSLSLDDLGDYILAVLGERGFAGGHGVAKCLEAAACRLSVVARLTLDALPQSTGCDGDLPMLVEQYVKDCLTAGGVEDVTAVEVRWARCDGGLWLSLSSVERGVQGRQEGADGGDDSMVDVDSKGSPRAALLVTVRVSEEKAVSSVLNQLAGLQGALPVGAGAKCGLSVTWLSDGTKAVQDWRLIMQLILAVLLATMPPEHTHMTAPVPSVPVGSSLLALVGQRLSSAMEAIFADFLQAPALRIEQVRKGLLLSQTEGQRAEQLERVLEAAQVRAKQRAHHDIKILRSLLFRRYGLTVTHLEQQRQEQLREGGTGNGSDLCLQARRALVPTSTLDSCAALPYAQVHLSLQAAAQAGVSAQGGSDPSQVKTALFAGTPTVKERHVADSSFNISPKKTPMFGVDSVDSVDLGPVGTPLALAGNPLPTVTPHRLVARQSQIQASMASIGQPSPFLAPWQRQVDTRASPARLNSSLAQGDKATADQTMQPVDFTVDEEVTFGHGRSKLGASLSALVNSPSTPNQRFAFASETAMVSPALTSGSSGMSMSGNRQGSSAASGLALRKQAAGLPSGMGGAGLGSPASMRSARQRTRMGGL